MIKHAIGVFSKVHPAKFVLLCYLFYALLGWLVLMMPICQTIAVSGLDHFFTAIAAMSTTGLTTVDIGTHYTMLGQVMILLLIQIGGIGYMTFNSFVILATTNKLSRFSKKITSAEFPLPKNFHAPEFILHVVIFTLCCEIIGMIVLSFIFRNQGIENYIWNAIFHSISAFCTAGFSLFPDNFIGFKYDIGLSFVISSLSILGAIGFITWLNFYKKVMGQQKYLSFTAKIILVVTFWFLTAGTAIFLLCENSGAQDTFWHRLMTGFFQVMSASTTAGFQTIDLSILKPTSIVLLLFLMAIGASPSGTGGGLKSTTFIALVGLVKSTLRGETVVSFWKREIPKKRLQLATATFSYYIIVLIIAVFILLALESKPFVPILFEAASALGTIGLSMGITPFLTEGGKVLISLLMIMGKIGILTFGIALTTQATETSSRVEFKKDNELVF